MPIVPAEARLATLNINAIQGGQAGEDIQTPCVADHCEVIFDRRYLPEEGFDSTKREIEELVRRVESESPERKYRISDLMVVHPVEAPRNSRLVAALEQGIRSVTGNTATLVASPGTYDQKHVTRIGGIDDCVAYGPGRLELAHQPDEYCEIDDLVASAQVMALALVDLLK
jgi:succinyl-diaminopimelate desuccinylase